MAKVSISEAARLTQTSRPTLYKMINSGELNFTSTLKAGKSVKVIDTSELIRVFGDINGVEAATAFTVKNEPEFTPVNSADLQHLQHQIELLQQENKGLKEAVAARDEHIASVRQAMLLLEHKKETALPVLPAGKWWQFWK
jgi:excisionase family DNA binding protein